MQMKNPVKQLLRALSPRPRSSRRGSPTRARPYIGALRGSEQVLRRSSTSVLGSEPNCRPGRLGWMLESPPAKGPTLPVAAVPAKRKTDWEGSWGPGGGQPGNGAGRGREITAFLIHEPARPSRDAWVMKGLEPGFLDL